MCLSVGGGGMRVGPQYQAVVPDFDPGKTLKGLGSLEVE